MMMLLATTTVGAQQVNDNNTPLHLMRPANQQRYGVPTRESVKKTMDRVLQYIDSETPAQLVDKRTGKEVTRLKDIDQYTQLKQGGFRLTSYEWGVTYSGVLAAYKATGDKAYRDYVYKRQKLLSDMAPYFQKVYAKHQDIDVNVRRVIELHCRYASGWICILTILLIRSIVWKTVSLPVFVRRRIRYGWTTCLWVFPL